MQASYKPIGEIVLVGRAAYQVFSHSYRGEVEYRAEVGKPYKDKATGVTKILPFMQDHSTRDFIEATQRASGVIEELRQSAFRQDTHKLAASVSPLSIHDEETLERLALKLA